MVGVTAGLSTLSKSVNEELKDVSYSIRSLDQSYSIPAQKSCGAWTAGSSFKQEPVQKSVASLKKYAAEQEKKQAAQAERLQKQLEQQHKRDAEKERAESDRKRRQPQARQSDSGRSNNRKPEAPSRQRKKPQNNSNKLRTI